MMWGTSARPAKSPAVPCLQAGAYAALSLIATCRASRVQPSSTAREHCRRPRGCPLMFMSRVPTAGAADVASLYARAAAGGCLRRL